MKAAAQLQACMHAYVRGDSALAAVATTAAALPSASSAGRSQLLTSLLPPPNSACALSWRLLTAGRTNLHIHTHRSCIETRQDVQQQHRGRVRALEHHLHCCCFDARVTRPARCCVAHNIVFFVCVCAAAAVSWEAMRGRELVFVCGEWQERCAVGVLWRALWDMLCGSNPSRRALARDALTSTLTPRTCRGCCPHRLHACKPQTLLVM